MIPPSIRKIKIRRRPRRKLRRRRRRRIPELSSKPQRLGPGSTSIMCNKLYNFNFDDTDVHTVNLGDLVLNQPEFLLRKSIYKYMKIRYVKFTFLPVVRTNSDTLLYLQLAYLQQPETTNLETDDQTKIVTPFRPKPKSFTFLPPNITMANFQGTVYNLKEWLPAGVGIVNMPLTVLFKKSSAGTTGFPCQIYIKVSFRGSNTVTVETIKGITKSLEGKHEELLQEDIKDKKENDKEENGEDSEEDEKYNISEELKGDIHDIKEELEEDIGENINDLKEDIGGNIKKLQGDNKGKMEDVKENIKKKIENKNRNNIEKNNREDKEDNRMRIIKNIEEYNKLFNKNIKGNK